MQINQMKTVTVQVPASSANLGPGFDALGLALALHNEITVIETNDDLQIAVTGEGENTLPTDEHNLIYTTMLGLFERVGYQPRGYTITCHNCIPVQSGLGSSSSAIVAGLLAGNAIAGDPFSCEELFQIATELEGHPDNVAPAFYGGLTAAVTHNGEAVARPIPIPNMQMILVFPEVDFPTERARAILPKMVTRQDAIYNIGRTTLLTHALSAGDFDLLTIAMHDKIHQPYRIPLVPGLADAMSATRDAGASAAVLSGAGPSLIAFAPDRHEEIAAAAQSAFAAAGVPSRSWILGVEQFGARFL